MREGLSETTRALLATARTDAPQAAAKAKIWAGVSTAAGVGGAAAAGVAAGGAGGGAPGTGVAGALSSGKLMALGALFGSALTVGVAAVVLRVVLPSAGAASPQGRVNASVPASPSEPQEAPVLAPVQIGAPAPVQLYAPAPTVPAATSRVAPATTARPQTPRAAREDPLMREAALVAEARGALMRGNAEGALGLLTAASRMGSRELEPEELSLTARALLSLGRSAEAERIEAELRTRYPDHALAR